MIIAQLKYFKCLCIFRIDKRLSQRFSGLAIESYERYQAVLLWCERMKRQQNIYIKSQRLDFAFHTLSIVQSAEFEVFHLFFSFSKHLYDTIFITTSYICTWKQKNIKWSFPVESREAFFKCTFHILQCLIRNIWGKCGLTRLSYTHIQKVGMLLLFRTNKVFFFK